MPGHDEYLALRNPLDEQVEDRLPHAVYLAVGQPPARPPFAEPDPLPHNAHSHATVDR